MPRRAGAGVRLTDTLMVGSDKLSQRACRLQPRCWDGPQLSYGVGLVAVQASTHAQ